MIEGRKEASPAGCAVVAQGGASFGSDRLEQTEVGDLNIAVKADQDVVRFEVAVDDDGLELMQALRTRENAAMGEEQKGLDRKCECIESMLLRD